MSRDLLLPSGVTVEQALVEPCPRCGAILEPSNPTTPASGIAICEACRTYWFPRQ